MLELCEGGSLYERIVEKGGYKEEEAREVLLSLLSIVSHLHANNIVHRDLKPENILCKYSDNDVDVKLGDYGLAAVLASPTSQLYEPLGTPYYVGKPVINDPFFVSPYQI